MALSACITSDLYVQELVVESLKIEHEARRLSALFYRRDHNGSTKKSDVTRKRISLVSFMVNMFANGIPVAILKGLPPWDK